ncbi:hypothetical protein F2Q70_00043630 [Brassica cretica]|uniref:Uncharacterized protein n=1 Tax=Brassica cretica TaxID=69181 RepID=A0A8S9KGU3_BRACR|nr:hypothetical protein F2Q70_00043630 [Brassica cretica]
MALATVSETSRSIPAAFYLARHSLMVSMATQIGIHTRLSQVHVGFLGEIQLNNISGDFLDLSSLKNLNYLDASDRGISGWSHPRCPVQYSKSQCEQPQMNDPKEIQEMNLS